MSGVRPGEDVPRSYPCRAGIGFTTGLSFLFGPSPRPWQPFRMIPFCFARVGRGAVRVAAVLALGAPAVVARAGTSAESNLRPQSSPPAVQYTNSAAPIPNYLQGQRWGTQGEAISRMQLPLAPDDSARHEIGRAHV